MHVEALTTVYGNGTSADCTRNALVILETAGRSDIPVYQGVGKPLMAAPTYGSQVHGSDALGDVGVPPPIGAPQARHWCMSWSSASWPAREITLVALGPLTNVALALSLEPRLASALAELIVMGGAVLTHGNITEVATANLYNDSDGSHCVSIRAPVVQVGMDVCQKVAIPEAHLERFQHTPTPLAQL